MNVIKFIFFCILSLFFCNCKTDIIKNSENQKDNRGKKIENCFNLPKTFKKEEDKFIDSLFINIPSEGTVLEIFDKKEGTLYVFDAIATMAKYNIELFIKSDSSFLLKKIEYYNQPLNIPDAKLESQSIEYFSYYKDSLLFFYRDGREVIDRESIAGGEQELRMLKEILRKRK